MSPCSMMLYPSGFMFALFSNSMSSCLVFVVPLILYLLCPSALTIRETFTSSSGRGNILFLLQNTIETSADLDGCFVFPPL